MNDRRNFLSWFAGLFVATPVVANEPIWGKQGEFVATPVVANEPIWGKQGEWSMYKQYPQQKGFIVVTLNVGTLPAYKAEGWLEKVREKWRKDNGRPAFDDWELIMLPVRPPQESKVEIFALNGEIAKNDYVKAQRLIVDETPFEYPDKKQIKDYVLLMLGAPVVRIELDEQQMDCCYDMTRMAFEGVQKAKGGFPLRMMGLGQTIFRQMVQAKAMMMLGMVRNKFRSVEPLWLDGESLYEQGTNLHEYTMQYLEG